MIGERRVAAARPARGARVSDNGLRRYAAGQRLASGRHIQVTLRHHKRDIKKHLAATPRHPSSDLRHLLGFNPYHV